MKQLAPAKSFADAAKRYLDTKVSRQFLPAEYFSGSDLAFAETGLSLWVKEPKRPDYADGIKLISVVAERSRTVLLAYCDIGPAVGFSALAELAWQAEHGKRFDVLHSISFNGSGCLEKKGIHGFILFSPQTLSYSRGVSAHPRLVPESKFLFAVPVAKNEYTQFKASRNNLMEHFKHSGRDLMTWRLKNMEPVR